MKIEENIKLFTAIFVKKNDTNYFLLINKDYMSAYLIYLLFPGCESKYFLFFFFLFLI
jgi:hypothetical protein